MTTKKFNSADEESGMTTSVTDLEQYRQNKQDDALLIKLEEVRTALVQIKTIEEAAFWRRKAKALEEIAKAASMAHEIKVEAAELRVRWERRLGQVMKDDNTSKNRGVRNQLKGKTSSGGIAVIPPEDLQNFTPTYAELGINKSLITRAYKLASIPDGAFEETIAQNRTQATTNADRAVDKALSANAILRVHRYTTRPDKELEFSSLIKPSDNWNFSPVEYGRVDQATDDDWGYIPGEVYLNCLWHYTKPGDLVVAPMAGAGQIQRVYDDRKHWMGEHSYDLNLRMLDLTPRGRYKDLILKNDLIQGLPIKNIDYIVIDIPYYGMVQGQYSNDSKDLANMMLEDWQISMGRIAQNCHASQVDNGMCTIITPNYRDVANRKIHLITDIVRILFESAGYILFDKAYSSRRIQQQQNANIARMNNLAKRNRIMLTDITEILTFIKQER